MDKAGLLALFSSGVFNIDEVGVIALLSSVERPMRIPFSLNEIEESDVISYFRFNREDIPRLSSAFRLPEVIILENRSRFEGIEALCILLRRLSYPNRYVDLKQMFRREVPELSMICTWMIEYLNRNFGHLLTSLDLYWLTLGDLRKYSKAVSDKGSPLPDIWGFIDGTFRPTCRPGEDQKTLYSGHYRLHGIKFQAVMTPNGIIANLDGPWVGRRHDSGMLTESGLLDSLRVKMETLGQKFRLYGDPAYPISEYIEGPFRKGAAELTVIEKDFNEAMSGLRIAVEWGFGEVIQTWAFLDFYKNLKIGLQPVGTYYAVGTLLTNCRVCLGLGGKVSDFFGVPPPSLEEYLNNQKNE